MKRVLALTVSICGWAAIAACTQNGPLKVDSVEPNQGITGGGDEVTIVGSGFQPGKTQAEVRFGHRKSESVQIASTTKLRVVTPPNEKGPVDVTVQFDNSDSMFKIPNGFRYQEPADSDNARRAFFSGGQKSSSGSKIEIEKKQ
jgi:hypothetical protein